MMSVSRTRSRSARPRRSSGGGRGAADARAVAEAVQRMAVLLEAGLTPAQAWPLLAEAGDPAALEVVGAPPGASIAEVLAAQGGAWREVAVAWRVAETVGAPLAPSLRRFADVLRDAQDIRDDVAVALADPAATARLMAWLPLVAVVLGGALGFDVAAAAGHPVGIACLVAGLTLILAARRWSRRLVAAAQPTGALPGVQADTMAIALSGGVSLDRALTVLRAAGGGEPQDAVHDVLGLSRRSGAPAVELLRASAAELRRAARTEGRLRAARLSARLLLPMGLCTLPAFLLLGVGPMLLSVLAGPSAVLAPP